MASTCLFRQSYATSLTEYLPDAASTEGFDLVLARALVLSMTSADPSNPDAFSSNAGLVREILVQGKLVELPADPTAPVDAIVVLDTVDSAVDSTQTASVADRSAVSTIQLKLVTAATTDSKGTVVVGTTPLEGDLVSMIRNDGDLAASTTTVTDVDSVTGQVTVPLALAARLAGQVGQFGAGTGATAALPPRVTLAPVVRGAVDPGASGGTATGEGDAG